MSVTLYAELSALPIGGARLSTCWRGAGDKANSLSCRKFGDKCPKSGVAFPPQLRIFKVVGLTT